MGGFYLYDGVKPSHPLHYKDVVYLVRRGLLVPPTVEEIRDKSKGDSFSKVLALLQAAWFMAQCITRLIQHLPITELEIATLAYIAVNVGMYWFWWDKPLNVAVPIRVLYNGPFERRKKNAGLLLCDCLMYGPKRLKEFGGAPFGMLATDSGSLDKRKRVPTFYSTGAPIQRQLALSMVAYIIFGAVHCAAWMLSFPTHTEQRLWRIFSVAILGVPVLSYITFLSEEGEFFDSGKPPILDCVSSLLWYLQPFVALSYVIARIVLLTLAFTSLRALPAGAYDTVAWTDFIPHI